MGQGAMSSGQARLAGEPSEDRRDGIAPGAGDDPNPICADLSNDYLNHYGEVLMLIEMASDDPDVFAVLDQWRPMDYRTYFAASALSRAPAALAAYEALPEARRRAFEELTRAMDTLAMTGIVALQPPYRPGHAALVAEVTVPPLRRLIERAASFLNSGGRDVGGAGEVEEAQAVIDRLLEQTGRGD